VLTAAACVKVPSPEGDGHRLLEREAGRHDLAEDVRDLGRRQRPVVARHHATQHLRLTLGAIEVHLPRLRVAVRGQQLRLLHLGDLLRTLGAPVQQLLQLQVDAISARMRSSAGGIVISGMCTSPCGPRSPS
jgi:hypothetical protein